MTKKTTTKTPRTFNPPEAAPKKSKEVSESPNNAPDLGLLNNWLTFATEAARKKQWEWYVIDQFLSGNQDVRANPEDNSIIVSKQDGQVNFPINMMLPVFRAVRGFVTRHKPKIEVETTDDSEEAKNYARRANKVIERDNQLNNSRRLNKEWVYYGVKCGVGYRQIGYDPINKVTQRWTIDPMDLLIGSRSGNFEDAPYLIKSLVRTVGYWESKFPDKTITPDNEMAHSEAKKLIFQTKFQNNSANGQSRDEQTAIGYECWYRVFKPNARGGFVNKCLFTKNQILEFVETPYTEYPFIAYRSEVIPNELYADGHMKNIVSPQRMLNLLNTQGLEYNHLVNRGRFQFSEGSGFRLVQAKEGQLIIHKPGKPVTVVNPPALNPFLDRQIGMSLDFIETIGGQHDASRGATPDRVSSGRAIEMLQLGDSNNISDLRDNFEDALSEEAAWILKMYALYEKDGIAMTDDTGGEKDSFTVVGSEVEVPSSGPNAGRVYLEDQGTYSDVCKILPENRVKVSVVSELGETREARLDLLFKLREAGLPLETVLKLIEFPNSSDVMKRIAEEALADLQMEQMKNQATQVPEGPPEVPPPTVPMPPSV